jgi:hypothetical protein
MDYNDIKFRIERTLESLNGRFDEDVLEHAHVDFYERGNERRVSITFGTQDEKVLINPIMIILHNLANLKDNLKNTLSDKGHDPQIVEKEINNCFHLQILIDIVNQEKHGSPLRKSRSLKNPKISNPSQGLRMASAIRDLEGNIISKNGPPAMLIDALICDENGNHLFRLDDLIESCYSKWISIARAYHFI